MLTPSYGWLGPRPWSALNLEPSDIGRDRLKPWPERTKVAIIGAGPSKHSAPTSDPSWELWTCTCLAVYDHPRHVRAGRWFELHPLDVQTARELAFMRECPVRLYTVEDFSNRGMPTSVRYPIERVIKETGGQDYFACTFALQLGLAYVEGFREIGLYGVSLPFGTRREQTVERACVEWWLGWLEGKGVRLHLMAADGLALHPPNWTSTTNRPRYGLDYWDEKRAVDQLMAQSSNL